MELNSFSGIWKEIKQVYKNVPSHLRGFDAFILFGALVVILQLAYAVVSNAYPFNSMISSISGSLGFIVLILALRLHLTPEVNSTVTNSRAFVDFLLSISLLFLFVWNFMN